MKERTLGGKLPKVYAFGLNNAHTEKKIIEMVLQIKSFKRYS